MPPFFVSVANHRLLISFFISVATHKLLIRLLIAYEAILIAPHFAENPLKLFAHKTQINFFKTHLFFCNSHRNIFSMAGTSKMTNTSKAGARTPSHVRTPISKTTLGKTVVVTPGASAILPRAEMKCYCTSLRGRTEIVFTFEDRQGNPGFNYPFYRFCNNALNAKLVKGQARLNYVGWIRDPNEPTALKQGNESSTGFVPHFLCSITSLEESQVVQNTHDNRDKLGARIEKIWNSNTLQIEFKNPPGSINPRTRLAYCGDITPHDPDQVPYLSDFLTLAETLAYVKSCYLDPVTNDRLSNEELITDKGLVEKYFSPNLHEVLFRLYGPNRQQEDLLFDTDIFA